MPDGLRPWRWIGPLWLGVYLSVYATTYSPVNFLSLCDVSVTLTAFGLWWQSRLLLSSQAVACTGIGVLWTFDLAGRLLTGAHPLGFTAYMWDDRYPCFARSLSGFHLAQPVLLWVWLRRLRYDPRGWALQSVIAGVVLGISRLASMPAGNLNYVFHDPLCGRVLGPPLVHLGLVWVALCGVLYGPTHQLLKRCLGEATSEDRP